MSFNGALGGNFYDEENEICNRKTLKNSSKGGKGGANMGYTLLICSALDIPNIPELPLLYTRQCSLSVLLLLFFWPV